MDAYVYQAALLCRDCAQKRIIAIESTRPLPPGYPDSDSYPQGLYPQGGGEADTPQHCDDCREFLQNPLTGDGYKYVVEALCERIIEGRGTTPVLREWADFYSGEYPDLDRAIQRWKTRLPFDWCIPVIFRAERSGDFKGEVTACLPTVPGNPGMATCYAHIGQHGAYSWQWYATTRPAKPEEYADLLAELRQIYGDELKVYQRETRAMRAHFARESRR